MMCGKQDYPKITLVLERCSAATHFIVLGYLTKFELHKFWSEYRKSDCIKVFIFKVANILVLNWTTRNTALESDGCALAYMSEQYYYVLLIDIGCNACFAIFGNLAQRFAAKVFSYLLICSIDLREC